MLELTLLNLDLLEDLDNEIPEDCLYTCIKICSGPGVTSGYGHFLP